MIGKAVTLSEAIARSDRGPMPKIKEMMKSLKIQQVTDDISRALDQMNQEIVDNSGSIGKTIKPQSLEQMIETRYQKRRGKKEKTAAQRRESHITHGLVSFFSGIGLMTFLYFLSSVLVLKLPEQILADIPFELDPVVRIIWLVGLIPLLTGVGRILAGFSIRPEPDALRGHSDSPDRLRSEIPNAELEAGQTNELAEVYQPPSVTERTTNILNRR